MTNASYESYLQQQLARTLVKIDTNASTKAAYLATAVQQVIGSLRGKRVLCIGCRNRHELDLFEQLGAIQVVGIDLQTTDPRILVMDMHQLQFPDNSFDLVYSCHSLEHAFDPKRAAAEMVRVSREAIAIEVPIRYQTSGVDLWDYGSIAGVHQLFSGTAVRWSEEGTAENNSNQIVARLVLATAEQPQQQVAQQSEQQSVHPSAPVQTSTSAPTSVSLKADDVQYSMRRYFVDEFYTRHVGRIPAGAKVLDIGGKKLNKRGQFDIGRYPLTVQYANSDATTSPDFLCDATQIPVADGSYDVVILAEVMEHVPAPGLVLQEASRLLKPGGVFLATAPFFVRIHPDPLDIGRYTPQWWQGSLEQVGFNQISIESQGAFFSVIADFICGWMNDLNKRDAFYPGTKDIALSGVSWLKTSALNLEENIRASSHPFFGAHTTGFGVVAFKA